MNVSSIKKKLTKEIKFKLNKIKNIISITLVGSFVYQKDADESRTDNNFDCPEIALEQYLYQSDMKVYFAPSICLPFYQYAKTPPDTDIPNRQKEQKLIDADGNLVEQR